MPKGKLLRIPGTNHYGEAKQELYSFDRAWSRVEAALPGGVFKPALINGHPAIVYDHPDYDDLFAMRLEMGHPPVLRWMGAPRSAVDFIIEMDDDGQ